MNSNETPSVRERILQKIESNEVRMRSRAYFMLRVIGVLVLSLAILAVSIFICMFLFFTLRLNGHDALPGLGAPGILLFLRLFPWHLLLLDVALVVLLRYVLRQFPQAYRTPWLYAVIALAAISIAVGLAIDRETTINDHLLDRSDRGMLPSPLRDAYQGARRPLPPGIDAFRGTIASIASSSIVLIDPDDNTTRTVILPEHPRRPIPQLSLGEAVFVLGRASTLMQGTIIATDIHPINPRGLAPGL